MDFNCGYYLEVQKRCLSIKVFWALCQFDRATVVTKLNAAKNRRQEVSYDLGQQAAS